MMNPKTRQRAMRGFLASLLQSDMTVQEMHELAEDLAFGTFGRELGDFIRDAMHVTEAGRYKEASSYNREPHFSGSPVPLALDIIAQRRLPKKMVLQIMSLASSWMKPQSMPSSATMRDIVERYVLAASSTEVSKFLNVLQGEPMDAYMKGIAKRDRAK